MQTLVLQVILLVWEKCGSMDNWHKKSPTWILIYMKHLIKCSWWKLKHGVYMWHIAYRAECTVHSSRCVCRADVCVQSRCVCSSPQWGNSVCSGSCRHQSKHSACDWPTALWICMMPSAHSYHPESAQCEDISMCCFFFISGAALFQILISLSVPSAEKSALRSVTACVTSGSAQ